MFRFTTQGRIGSINEYKNDTLRISLAADRLVEGNDGQWTKTEWMACVSFDPALNKEMLSDLEVGQSVILEGRLVPKLRDKSAEKKLYDPMLEITRFQRVSKPKAPKAKTAQTAEASA